MGISLVSLCILCGTWSWQRGSGGSKLSFSRGLVNEFVLFCSHWTTILEDFFAQPTPPSALSKWQNPPQNPQIDMQIDSRFLGGFFDHLYLEQSGNLPRFFSSNVTFLVDFEMDSVSTSFKHEFNSYNYEASYFMQCIHMNPTGCKIF